MNSECAGDDVSWQRVWFPLRRRTDLFVVERILERFHEEGESAEDHGSQRIAAWVADPDVQQDESHAYH